MRDVPNETRLPLRSVAEALLVELVRQVVIGRVLGKNSGFVRPRVRFHVQVARHRSNQVQLEEAVHAADEPEHGQAIERVANRSEQIKLADVAQWAHDVATQFAAAAPEPTENAHFLLRLLL